MIFSEHLLYLPTAEFCTHQHQTFVPTNSRLLYLPTVDFCTYHQQTFVPTNSRLLYPPTADFSALQMAMNDLVHRTEWNVKALYNSTKFNMFIIMSQPFNEDNIVICYGCIFVVWSLDICYFCPNVIEVSAPNPKLLIWHDIRSLDIDDIIWHDTRSLDFNKLVMKFIGVCPNSQKSSHFAHMHVWPYCYEFL